jgi:hypothetical protein
MRSHRLIWCAASALLVAGCGGGLQIDTDYNPQADFAAVETYAWAQRTPDGNEDPRVYNAIVEGRVKSAIDDALQAKGLRLVTSSPDVWVAWHGAIQGKMSYETISNDYGYGWGRYGRTGGMAMGTTTSRTTAREWDEGTLLIDIIDRRTEELMWRAVGQAKLSETARTPEEAQARADEVAVKMLADFPPGGSQ